MDPKFHHSKQLADQLQAMSALNKARVDFIGILSYYDKWERREAIEDFLEWLWEQQQLGDVNVQEQFNAKEIESVTSEWFNWVAERSNNLGDDDSNFSWFYLSDQTQQELLVHMQDALDVIREFLNRGLDLHVRSDVLFKNLTEQLRADR